MSKTRTEVEKESGYLCTFCGWRTKNEEICRMCGQVRNPEEREFLDFQLSLKGRW